MTAKALRKKALALRSRILHHARLGEPARKLHKAYYRTKGQLAEAVRKERRAQKNAAVERAVKAAEHDIGTVENPAFSNSDRGRGRFGSGPVIDQYILSAGYHEPEPYCTCAVGAWLRKGGVKVPPGVGYSPNIRKWAEQGLYGFRLIHGPKRGALALYDFPDATYGVQHGELVTDSAGRTVGANTSSGNAGSQDNGGGVYPRNRKGQYVVAWVWPPYPSH